MKKQVALVTGAASGIGFALTEHFYKQGYKVWASDMNLQAAEDAVSSLSADDGAVTAIKLDVTSQADIDHVIKHILEIDGSIDVLINNAGIQHVAPLEEFPVEKWKLVNDVLLVGPAMLARACLPAMKSNDYGRIINIGSIHGLVASPFKSAYVAAKHGLIGFSKVIGLETADQDITINTICPAYVKTALVEKQIADQARTHGISEEEVIDTIMLAPMPKKSFISFDELCGTVGYLLSDAARNMTAQTIVLDGAWTAR